MADTPRVTVPVETTPEMIEAFRDWYALHFGRPIMKGKARKIVRRILSAAPAPEGGAVSERLAEIATWTDEEWETVFAHRPDLRARMRAALATREDAQPVAWESCGPNGKWKRDDDAHNPVFRRKAELIGGIRFRPLYTHPAPDALRVAREALTALVIADDHRPRGLGTPSDWIRNSYAPAIALARQALAALQAEQVAK